MSHQIVSNYFFNDSLTQYGDGLFETMLGVENDIHHWNYHWLRLKNSCLRLQISVPHQDVIYQQIQSELANKKNKFSVVKMIVSRGEGIRGYRSLEQQPCYVDFTVFPYQLTPSLYQGLSVRICQMVLSKQPLLAGMKHTNRLEYVMARREVEDNLFDEGLLLDYDGHLIEGLISNLFMVQEQRIFTPILNNSGVAGTMRAYLLVALPTWGYDVEEGVFDMEDLVLADGAFLTNATAGVMSIANVNGINKTFDLAIANKIRKLVDHPCCEF